MSQVGASGVSFGGGGGGTLLISELSGHFAVPAIGPLKDLELCHEACPERSFGCFWDSATVLPFELRIGWFATERARPGEGSGSCLKRDD